MNIYPILKSRFSFLQKVQKKIILMTVLAISMMQASAQIPSNDEACTAIALTPAAACTYATFTNVNASASTPAPSPNCANFTDADVWFSVVMPVSGSVTIDTKNLVLTDGGMAVYTGACTALTQIACDDASSTNPDMPKISAIAPAGSTIYVRFWGFGGQQGTFGICVIANGVPPPNDDCTNATSLTVNPDFLCGTVTAGTTANGTQSTNTPAPTCGTAGGWNDDVWYKFTATGPTHRITLTNVSGSTSMTMAVYNGTCNAFTQSGCINANTLDVTGLTAGATYYVRVYTNTATSTTTATFNICVGTPPPPPANDECINAVALTVNPDFNCGVVTAGTTVSATQSANTPFPTCASTTAPGGYNDDVWYTFVATNVSHRISLINITGGTTDMAIQVLSGTCGAFTQVACSDPELVYVTGLIVGNTYYVRVMTWTSTLTTSASFNICIGTPPPPPANDNCAGAVSLTVNSDLNCGTVTAGSTISATVTAGAPAPSCGVLNASDDDVWYTFTATNSTHRLSITNVAPANTMVMVVYSGTCGTLTEVACNTTSLMQVSGLSVGTTYYVRVFTNTATAGNNSNFNICIGTPPPPPANDECAGAVNLTVNPDLNCGTITAGTTISATQTATPPNPTCGTVNGWNDDVWYSFTATNVNNQVSLLNITPVNAMVIVVYSGTCAGLTQIGCVAGNTLPLSGLIPGNVYYVRVYTNVVTVTTNSTFNICIGTPPPPPANDECINAVALTVNPDFNCGVVTAGTTVSATQSANTPIPTCASVTAPGGYNDDVWYTFVATNVSHRISLINITGGTTDMAIQVLSGTCGAFTQVACSDPELVNVTGLIVGNTYYVRVMTWTSTLTTTASFNICIGTPPPPPANDNCAGAVMLTVNPNYLCGTVTAGTTVSATPSANTPFPTCASTTAPGGYNDDVWYTFVATNVRHRISLINITGGTTDMAIQVLSGTCGAFTQVACSDPELVDVTGLIVGNTYYVRVMTWTSTLTTSASFNICIGTPPPPPSNDECTGAIALTVNSNQLCSVTTAGSTGGATQSATTPTPTCSPVNGWDDDVWFSFVAAGASHTVSLLNVTGSSTNMLTSVYTGTCGSLIQIACTTVDPNFINLSNLTAGTTYYVRVQTELSGAFDASFNICIGTPGPGAVCTAGNPFCSTSGVAYPSVTNQPSLGGGGVYGCLSTTPNPTWFYMQVSAPGNLVFQVSQTSSGGAGIDVDYAAWGPFTSQADGCNQIAAATVTPISCSYSIAAVETITIPNASVGQYYIVLITNYNGGAGTITFNTTTGNVGSTSCNIVCNVTASNNGPVCPGGLFNLTSTALSGSTFSWTGPNGFTSTQQNPQNVVAPATPGSYIYTVTAAINSTACSATTTVVVTAPPAAPTVTSPVTYCQGATSFPLTATGANLLWYATATGGTGSPTAPTPSTATAGSTTYYVSSTTGTCEGPRASITVIVNPTPAAPAVISPVLYCQGGTAVPLTATGTNLLWYTTATGGTGSTTAPIPSAVTIGSTTYYVSQTAGTCEGPRAAIVVSVSAIPAAPAVISPLAYCQNATAPALTATGANLLWYTTATGGTGSTTAPTPSTAAAGTFTYYVSQSTGNCEGPRAAIIVNITAALTANAGSDVIIASGQQTQLNGTGTPGANYLWTANGPLALSSATILNPIANPLQTTTYTLTVSDPTALCPSASDNVIVTVVTTCINVRNAFTPNGDGINDSWYVYDQSFCLKPGGVTVNVFNRYGNKVYESKNYTNNWDGTYKGKPVPDGTYFAIVEFTLSNGTKQIVRTDLTVLR